MAIIPKQEGKRNRNFFKSFTKRFEAVLNTQLASIVSDPNRGVLPTFGGTIKLTPQDQLLVAKGGTSVKALDVYYDLIPDPQVFACLDKILQEIISRELIVKPHSRSSKDLAIAKWVEDMLLNLGSEANDEKYGFQLASTHAGGFDFLTKSLGLAYIIGYQPAEIIWGFDSDGLITVKSVVPKDARRFNFESDSEGNIYPKLLFNDGGYDGVFLPPKKFIIHNFWAIASDDPYGFGIGRQLYYPVQWKREAFTYWLTSIDRYSQPSTVGSYPENASDDEVEEFSAFLANIARETSVALPESYSLEYIDADIKGAVDIFDRLVEVCDRYIALAILGEATTGEKVGNGLGGQREEVSNSIRIMKAKAISDGISNTLQKTLVKWAVQYRFGSKAKCPQISRDFEKKADISSYLDNAEKLKRLEFPLDFNQISETTGYSMARPEEEEEKEELPSIDDLLGQQQALLGGGQPLQS